VIDTDIQHPYYVTAADEVLAISCSEYDGRNTLHLYRRDPPGVSVGYFRKIENDIDIASCNELGIEIVRRSSGGGSIYTDRNQLIYSYISKKALGKNVGESFKLVSNCLIDALSEFGINASFKPPNDVLINGKKISGAAQVKKRKSYLIHSTVILTIDQNIIDRVLKNAKHGYVSSIEGECGFKPDIKELKTAIINATQEQFGITFQSEQFTELEKKLIHELVENKYGTDAWTFKR
jgi:lipoate-protein ligase A